MKPGLWLVRISQRAPLARQEVSQGLPKSQEGSQEAPQARQRPLRRMAGWAARSIPFSPCKPPDGVEKVRILAGLQIKISTAVRNHSETKSAYLKIFGPGWRTTLALKSNPHCAPFPPKNDRFRIYIDNVTNLEEFGAQLPSS